MGAGGAKNLQSEKARHAANVISAFEAYTINNQENLNNSSRGNASGASSTKSKYPSPNSKNFSRGNSQREAAEENDEVTSFNSNSSLSPEKIKAQIKLAAVDSKLRRGVDIDESLAELDQLDDADIVQFGKWVQSKDKEKMIAMGYNNNSNFDSSSNSSQFVKHRTRSASNSPVNFGQNEGGTGVNSMSNTFSNSGVGNTFSSSGLDGSGLGSGVNFDEDDDDDDADDMMAPPDAMRVTDFDGNVSDSSLGAGGRGIGPSARGISHQGKQHDQRSGHSVRSMPVHKVHSHKAHNQSKSQGIISPSSSQPKRSYNGNVRGYSTSNNIEMGADALDLMCIEEEEPQIQSQQMVGHGNKRPRGPSGSTNTNSNSNITATKQQNHRQRFSHSNNQSNNSNAHGNALNVDNTDDSDNSSVNSGNLKKHLPRAAYRGNKRNPSNASNTNNSNTNVNFSRYSNVNSEDGTPNGMGQDSQLNDGDDLYNFDPFPSTATTVSPSSGRQMKGVFNNNANNGNVVTKGFPVSGGGYTKPKEVKYAYGNSRLANAGNSVLTTVNDSNVNGNVKASNTSSATNPSPDYSKPKKVHSVRNGSHSNAQQANTRAKEVGVEEGEEDILQSMMASNSVYYDLRGRDKEKSKDIVGKKNNKNGESSGGNGNDVDTSRSKGMGRNNNVSNPNPNPNTEDTEKSKKLYTYHAKPASLTNPVGADEDFDLDEDDDEDAANAFIYPTGPKNYLVTNNTNAGSPTNKSHLYGSLSEQTDMRNEILMGLQRQKLWSYAENSKLEDECSMLQKQLDMMEMIDKEIMKGTYNGGKAAGIKGNTSGVGKKTAHTNGMESTPNLVFTPPKTGSRGSSSSRGSGSHLNQSEPLVMKRPSSSSSNPNLAKDALFHSESGKSETKDDSYGFRHGEDKGANGMSPGLYRGPHSAHRSRKRHGTAGSRESKGSGSRGDSRDSEHSRKSSAGNGHDNVNDGGLKVMEEIKRRNSAELSSGFDDRSDTKGTAAGLENHLKGSGSKLVLEAKGTDDQHVAVSPATKISNNVTPETKNSPAHTIPRPMSAKLEEDDEDDIKMLEYDIDPSSGDDSDSESDTGSMDEDTGIGDGIGRPSAILIAPGVGGSPATPSLTLSMSPTSKGHIAGLGISRAGSSSSSHRPLLTVTSRTSLSPFPMDSQSRVARGSISPTHSNSNVNTAGKACNLTATTAASVVAGATSIASSKHIHMTSAEESKQAASEIKTSSLHSKDTETDTNALRALEPDIVEAVDAVEGTEASEPDSDLLDPLDGSTTTVTDKGHNDGFDLAGTDIDVKPADTEDELEASSASINSFAPVAPALLVEDTGNDVEASVAEMNAKSGAKEVNAVDSKNEHGDVVVPASRSNGQTSSHVNTSPSSDSKSEGGSQGNVGENHTASKAKLANLKNATHHRRRQTLEEAPGAKASTDVGKAETKAGNRSTFANAGIAGNDTSNQSSDGKKRVKGVRRIPQSVKEPEPEPEGDFGFGVRGKNFSSIAKVSDDMSNNSTAGGGSNGSSSNTYAHPPRHTRAKPTRQRGNANSSNSTNPPPSQNPTKVIKEEQALLSQTLNIRYCEVELLLRKRINSDEDIKEITALAEEGLEFMDQLNDLSKSLGILRGTLSRWLLPYDSTTSITEQCSTPHSVMANIPDSLKGKVTERQVRSLVAGANNVRQLVRIKIADDNDLEQAKKALLTAVDFFNRIKEQAAAVNMTPYTLLNA